MKFVEKMRVGSKIIRTYDVPQTPCDLLLARAHVSKESKLALCEQWAALDPLLLSELIETKLQGIHEIIGEIEERRAEERARAGEPWRANPGGRPLGLATLRLWSLSLPSPTLHRPQRKGLPNPPPKEQKTAKSWCHE